MMVGSALLSLMSKKFSSLLTSFSNNMLLRKHRYPAFLMVLSVLRQADSLLAAGFRLAGMSLESLYMFPQGITQAQGCSMALCREAPSCVVPCFSMLQCLWTSAGLRLCHRPRTHCVSLRARLAKGRPMCEDNSNALRPGASCVHQACRKDEKTRATAAHFLLLCRHAIDFWSVACAAVANCLILISACCKMCCRAPALVRLKGIAENRLEWSQDHCAAVNI